MTTPEEITGLDIRKAIARGAGMGDENSPVAGIIARQILTEIESLGLVLMPREPTQDMWTFLDDEWPAAVAVFQKQIGRPPHPSDKAAQ